MKARVVLALISGAMISSSAPAQTPLIPVVAVHAPRPLASEAGPTAGSFQIERRGPTNTSLVVFYSLSGTASNGVDYQTIDPTVVIQAGALTASIPVVPIDDKEIEWSETVVLHLQPSPLDCAACGYDIGTANEAVATILDDDSPAGTNAPVVNVVVTDATASEIPLVPPWLDIPQRMDPAVFQVSRSDGTNQPLAVRYRLGGTAVNGLDYEALPGVVTIPAGSFVADITVWPIDDFIIEGDETVTVTLAPNCATAGVVRGCYVIGPSNEASAVILDNDTESNLPPVVTVVATEPHASEAGPVAGVFTFSRTGPAIDPMTVFFRTGGTARNGIDYEAISNYVVFPAGAGSAAVTVTPVDDQLVEGPETVEVQLVPLLVRLTDGSGLDPNLPLRWPPYLIGVPSNAVVTIADDDRSGTNRVPIVSIVARDALASEGTNFWRLSTVGALWTDGWDLWGVNPGGTNTATFVVHRSDVGSADLAVSYSVGGTASNGVDYIALPGTVVIPAGERAARITVWPLEDQLQEGLETVLLTLQPAPEYTIGLPARAAAVIVDNDQPRPPCRMLPDRMFHVCFPRTNGFCFRLEASANLRDWTALCTNVVTDGALHFVDPDAGDADHRFYRATPEPGLAPNE
jgi:hypothetical protein